ncbi:flagellar hook-associated protein FlgK [Parasulfuritortus cantonensis]|uniref:Flagellar hook-associated protein 1 n=1 Tax=Parasulfuritortus cantonensis TaxID=2528202 RepID=A0A4V2NW04_9PROT|nr:flagellar hook-associated protein FlgK [Parasulfuritortus cantonensis]TCJ15532.1 flagellar hook-associated protein FlgK [Parasulfuritortus cantonensis]
MGTGLLNISLSGLNAAMAGIRTVQQNIANANTAGYTRQEVVQSASTPQYSGGGYLGTGVQVDTVRRIYDQFLTSQTQNYQTQLSAAEAYSSYASEVDALLGGSSTGLSTPLQTFFSAVSEVANDPTSLTARQQMISTANSLASRFNLLADNLQSIKTEINSEVSTIATQINSYADQIQSLNAEIARAQGSGQTPNDLLDQRDQLVNELGKLVNVSSIQQSDGTVAVMIGNGQPLVVGTAVRHVVAVSDSADPTQTILAMEIPNSTATEVIDPSSITSGSLGGLFAFRDEVLNPSIADLDQLAQSLADAFNSQHEAGYDLNGAAGTAFFSYSATSPAGTLAVVISQASQVAAASQGVSAAADAGNSGDASIGAVTLSETVTRPLADAPYTLSYNAGTVTVTDASANVVGSFTYTSGATMTFDGISVAITDGSGGIADGDTFTIDNSGAYSGPGDNGNALLLAGLQNEAVIGSSTLSEYNTALVGRNATYANSADTNVSNFTSLYQQSYDSLQSVSGVNLDEEAVKLIQLQQAYQAAAKAIQVSSTLFDAVLGAMQ